MTPFLTSKVGQIDRISIYSYTWTENLLNQSDQFNKLKFWLMKSEDNSLFEITDYGFKTLKPLSKSSSWQYSFKESIELVPPFKNIQNLSSYISSLIRSVLSKSYTRFHRENTFITDSIFSDPFVLHKCIEFNVEIFENGKIYIHFLPVSKITSPEKISIEYLMLLRRNLNGISKDIGLTLVDKKTFRRLRVNDVNDQAEIENTKLFFENSDNIICTFDYHSIASFSPHFFGLVVNETIKNIDNSIFYLQEKLEKVLFSFDFNFQQKPFFKVEIKSLGKENNLIVGENKSVNKQSAAFYNGIFQAANNALIQPIFVNNIKSTDFKNIITRFNKNCEFFEVLDPIILDPKDEHCFDPIIQAFSRQSGKYLLAIITDYQLPKVYIDSLRKKKISYQIYLGEIDKYKMSNFAVKCLEKLGGHLSIIKNSEENENTYFIGIDLGHSISDSNGFSNIALVFFDNKGVILHSVVKKYLPRNESIETESIGECLESFRRYLKKHNRSESEKIIFHRDGKLHPSDIKSIVEQSKKHLNVDNIEIVEIIKHGYPVIACFDEGAYVNLESGDYYLNDNYAILITNVQVDEKNAIVNPLIIKHKYGFNCMDRIVKQVYWFTKVYTNNLYNSTRLPATTQKANNIVGTGKKQHLSTYEG